MPHNNQGRNVHIHIDGQVYESPNPTTGSALYALGHIVGDVTLYRDVPGQSDDDLIENNGDVVHLHNGDHFYSGPHREFIIIVNGQRKTVSTVRVTYEQVVALAYPTPPSGQDLLYAVTYDNGPHCNPEGTLSAGQSVKVKNGMIFNVTPTNKS